MTPNQTIFCIVAGLAIIPLFAIVHVALDRLQLRHVENYCRRNHIRYEFLRILRKHDEHGVKTDYTFIDLLFTRERRILRFEVSPLGIKSVGDHPYDPEDAPSV